MSKHVKIGKNRDHYQLSILYLEDDFMDFVHELKDVRKDYRELYRLVYDPRAYCEIYCEDLPRMREEITKLLNDRTTPTSMREVLKKLLKITETAISENKSLFAEAD